MSCVIYNADGSVQQQASCITDMIDQQVRNNLATTSIPEQYDLNQLVHYWSVEFYNLYPGRTEGMTQQQVADYVVQSYNDGLAMRAAGSTTDGVTYYPNQNVSCVAGAIVNPTPNDGRGMCLPGPCPTGTYPYNGRDSEQGCSPRPITGVPAPVPSTIPVPVYTPSPYNPVPSSYTPVTNGVPTGYQPVSTQAPNVTPMGSCISLPTAFSLPSGLTNAVDSISQSTGVGSGVVMIGLGVLGLVLVMKMAK